MKMIFSPVQSVSCVLDCTGAPISATNKDYVSSSTYVRNTYLRLISKDCRVALQLERNLKCAKLANRAIRFSKSPPTITWKLGQNDPLSVLTQGASPQKIVGGDSENHMVLDPAVPGSGRPCPVLGWGRGQAPALPRPGPVPGGPHPGLATPSDLVGGHKSFHAGPARPWDPCRPARPPWPARCCGARGW